MTDYVEISRGTAGDCCVRCGRVGIDLPVEHGCVPNLTPEQEAYRQQPRCSWDELPFFKRWDAQKTPASTATAIPPPISRAYVKAAFDNEISTLAATRPGSRNDQLNRSSFALGQLIGARVLAEAGTVDALTRTARSTGLGETEITATITSGIEAGKAQPRREVGR
jgi:hypothetical protein